LTVCFSPLKIDCTYLVIFMLQKMRQWFALSLLLPVLAAGLSGCNKVKAREDVAFMGDSITEMWSLPRVNLGIHGQTTSQMLNRFPADVLPKKLHAVIILGGTNDVLLGVDPDVTIANLKSMAELASSHGIEPILCEIPPIYARQNALAPNVAALNRRIVELAASRKLRLVDYYDAMNGHPSYFSDGIHMKKLGYLLMDWTLEKRVAIFHE